jgi:hypothetical protein
MRKARIKDNNIKQTTENKETRITIYRVKLNMGEYSLKGED